MYLMNGVGHLFFFFLAPAIPTFLSLFFDFLSVSITAGLTMKKIQGDESDAIHLGNSDKHILLMGYYSSSFYFYFAARNAQLW